MLKVIGNHRANALRTIFFQVLECAVAFYELPVWDHTHIHLIEVDGFVHQVWFVQVGIVILFVLLEKDVGISW